MLISKVLRLYQELVKYEYEIKALCKASDFWQFKFILVHLLCGCLRIRAAQRGLLLLSSQSDSGSVVPDCGCRNAGSVPHQPGSAGYRKLQQTGSRWGAAN